MLHLNICSKNRRLLMIENTNKKGWFLSAFFIPATNCRATICHIVIFYYFARLYLSILDITFLSKQMRTNL